MSIVEEPSASPSGRGEGYLSPALSRLQEPPRPVAAVRGIAEAPIRTAEGSLTARLGTLEDRLAELEQQQAELVDNLCQAHQAFLRLVERMAELEARTEARR